MTEPANAATPQCPKLQQFHQHEPSLKRPSGIHSAFQE
jgi:hypothetical protein